MSELITYLSSIQVKILEFLKEGPMSRDDLCKKFGYGKHTYYYNQAYPDKRQSKRRYHRELIQYRKRSTVYDNLLKLKNRGLVEKYSFNNGKRGRSVVMWRLV